MHKYSCGFSWSPDGRVNKMCAHTHTCKPAPAQTHIWARTNMVKARVVQTVMICMYHKIEKSLLLNTVNKHNVNTKHSFSIEIQHSQWNWYHAYWLTHPLLSYSINMEQTVKRIQKCVCRAWKWEYLHKKQRLTAADQLVHTHRKWKKKQLLQQWNSLGPLSRQTSDMCKLLDQKEK